MSDVLKMGMVGGGRGAFIGQVHRTAACLDGKVRMVAGCLSSTADKAIASGKDWGLADSRNYQTWEAMLEGEKKLPASERIDFVSIVTPNHVHFPVAHAFASAGFNVVCDKPLVHTGEQARQLIEATKKMGVVFAVTYNYSGYPMVKQAREMIVNGELGEIRKVVVEYNQGWLANNLEASGQKQANWRTDPKRSGAGGAIGDIGSHCEQLVSYVTGLRLQSICADLTSFVPGRQLDDDANVLLRFCKAGASNCEGTGPDSMDAEPGARGILTVSQICIGHENDLRLRVHGTKGTLGWLQEEPNYLVLRQDGQPEKVYRRGNGYLGERARGNTRLPSGHPEAFFEAFATVYSNACAAMRARSEGKGNVGGIGMGGAGGGFDYPDVVDGARGVEFIERVVEASASSEKWVRFAGK
ncbi:MAG: Gfo/Idh/MocA family oxidoreductase [Phycisphaerales bacterium]|nr:Gfo/Idh/MocA family oxidoreductase [Phycisphaerales bacterium]